MPPISLRKITIQNFRSFRSPVTVEFPQSGLVLIRGVNQDTHGSSGAGKSTINLAIAYAMKFCPYPATALQAWGVDEPPSVTLEFDTPEGVAVLVRGAKLSLTVDGTVIRGNAKIVEEHLDRLLGMSPEMRAALTYRGQRQPGLFLSKTDSEKKEFLTALLGLDKLEQAIETSQAKLGGLEARATEQLHIITNKQKQLDDTRPTESVEIDLVPLQKEVDGFVEAVAEAQSNLATAESSFKSAESYEQLQAKAVFVSYQTGLADQQKQIDAIQTKTATFSQDHYNENLLLEKVNFLKAQITAHKKRDEDRKAKQLSDASGLRTELRRLRSLAGSVASLESKLLELKTQFDRLRTNVCPTCERIWGESEAKQEAIRQESDGVIAQLIEAKEAHTTILIKERELEAALVFTASPEIETLGKDLQEVEVDLALESSRLKNEFQLYKSEMDLAMAEAKARYAGIENKAITESAKCLNDPNRKSLALKKKIDDCRLMLDADRSELRKAETALAESVAQNKMEQALYVQTLGVFQSLEQEFLKAKELHNLTTIDLALERDFLGLMGREGFLGVIFEEVLDEISTTTNSILASVANTAHCTLHFRCESVTQKGATKRSITPVVSIGGVQAPLQSGLSGGMISSVELAVDLAVGAVISRRTGTSLGWMILDESFDGMDQVTKESCIEMLQRNASDRMILVVDHASETKECFARCITVNFANGESTLA